MKGMSFSQLPFKLRNTFYSFKKVEKSVFVNKINLDIGNFSLLQIYVFKLGFFTKFSHIFNHIKQWTKLDVIKIDNSFLTQM
jgi:hypothetical protein